MIQALQALVLLVAAAVTGADGPDNLTFELDSVGKPPTAWFIPGPAASAGWTAAVRSNIARREGKCTVLSRRTGIGGAGAVGGGSGNLMQQIDATPFRGKRIVMTAWLRVKPENEQSGGRAQMWMRVDREGGKQGFFDNSSGRPATTADWEQFKIIADVEGDAVGIALGFMAFGASVWIDDVTFNVVGDAMMAAEPPRELTDRGAINIVAFTRLVGFIRYYHPSDEAAACDWEAFVRAHVPAIESAEDADELATVFRAAFAPLAPAVVIRTEPFASRFEPESMLLDGESPKQATAWFRYGFSAAGDHGIYEGIRLNWAIDADAPDHVAHLGDHKTAEVAPGVWVRMPMAVYRNTDGTLPHATSSFMPASDATWVRPSGDDRTTRIADVILAWNVFQHHYPYFDVVGVDWGHELVASLREAATEANGEEFHATLERLVAKLEDGHGYVGYSGVKRWAQLPLAWCFIDERLVVTEVAHDTGELHDGDEVLEINGHAVAQLAAEAAARVSASTPQFRRFRTASELARGEAGQVCELKLRRPNGEAFTHSLAYVQGGGVVEPRPDKVAELQTGIWYVDIDRVNDANITAIMDKLAAADGLVFDLRGYPGGLSTIILAHLTNAPLQSAKWCVPFLPRPDRDGMSFSDGGWPVEPAQPRWTSNVAFIIDGRAISYAETYMGIVEHFKLAAIVGEATAGTNGNVTGFSLPGGYSIGFTGMRVLKHDGSTHHGIGIKPTIPVERTIEGIAAGRDEYLEAAIAHVEKNKPAK